MYLMRDLSNKVKIKLERNNVNENPLLKYEMRVPWWYYVRVVGEHERFFLN